MSKRQRLIRACAECRKRRIKCDLGDPCSACVRAQRPERCAPVNVLKNPSPRGVGILTSNIDQGLTSRGTYPTGLLPVLQHAAQLLPSPDRAEYLVQFYMENLDWYLEAGDFDDMVIWMPDFLRLVKHPMYAAGGAEKGDATRLALILSVILATLQVLSEDVLRVFFCLPGQAAQTETTFDRAESFTQYEQSLRHVLNMAFLHDSCTDDLLRALIFLFLALKNQGIAEIDLLRQNAQAISHIAVKQNLHREPDRTLPIKKQESLRRLFKTCFIIDRPACVDYGYISEIHDDQITCADPKPQSHSSLLGVRDHTVMICLSRLAALLGRHHPVIPTDAAVADFENQFSATIKSFPSHLQPGPISSYLANDRLIRFAVIQRIYLQGAMLDVRSTMHRLCFFPTAGVSTRQMHQSRAICINSAQSMLSLEETLRMQVVAEYHMRCFYFPYYTLEAAMTLILATLVELSTEDVSADGMEVSGSIEERKANKLAKVSAYLCCVHRAKILLRSVPSDFIAAFQGARLVFKIMERAESIVELYKTDQVSQVAIQSAIKNLIHDENGERIKIPYLERDTTSKQQQQSVVSPLPIPAASAVDISPADRLSSQYLVQYERMSPVQPENPLVPPLNCSHSSQMSKSPAIPFTVAFPNGSHTESQATLDTGPLMKEVDIDTDSTFFSGGQEQHFLFPEAVASGMTHLPSFEANNDEVLQHMVGQLDFWLKQNGANVF